MADPIDIDDILTALRQMNRLMEEGKNKAVDLGTSGSGGMEKLRSLMLGMRENVDRSTRSFGGLHESLLGISKTLLAPAGIAAGFYAATKSIQEFASGQVQLQNMSTNIGLNVKQTNDLVGAYRLLGYSAQEAKGILGNLFGQFEQLRSFKEGAPIWQSLKNSLGGPELGNALIATKDNMEAFRVLMETYSRQSEDGKRVLAQYFHMERTQFEGVAAALEKIRNLGFPEPDEAKVRKYYESYTLLRIGAEKLWESFANEAIKAFDKVSGGIDDKVLGKMKEVIAAMPKFFEEVISPQLQQTIITLGKIVDFINKIEEFSKTRGGPQTLGAMKPEDFIAQQNQPQGHYAPGFIMRGGANIFGKDFESYMRGDIDIWGRPQRGWGGFERQLPLSGVEGQERLYGGAGEDTLEDGAGGGGHGESIWDRVGEFITKEGASHLAQHGARAAFGISKGAAGLPAGVLSNVFGTGLLDATTTASAAQDQPNASQIAAYRARGIYNLRDLDAAKLGGGETDTKVDKLTGIEEESNKTLNDIRDILMRLETGTAREPLTFRPGVYASRGQPSDGGPRGDGVRRGPGGPMGTVPGMPSGRQTPGTPEVPPLPGGPKGATPQITPQTSPDEDRPATFKDRFPSLQGGGLVEKSGLALVHSGEKVWPRYPGGIDRSQWAKELTEENIRRLASMTKGEVGLGPKADLAKGLVENETLFNRATVRGYKSLMQDVYHGRGGYYAAGSFPRVSDAEVDFYKREILPRIMGGSDLGTQFLGTTPTGNASLMEFAGRRLRQGYYTAGRWWGDVPGKNEMFVQERQDAARMGRLSRFPSEEEPSMESGLRALGERRLREMKDQSSGASEDRSKIDQSLMRQNGAQTSANITGMFTVKAPAWLQSNFEQTGFTKLKIKKEGQADPANRSAVVTGDSDHSQWVP